MAILRREPSILRSEPDPNRIATTLAELCWREDLDGSETMAVLAVGLTWAPGLPRDPAPLLRSFSMAS